MVESDDLFDVMIKMQIEMKQLNINLEKIEKAILKLRGE